MAHKLITEVQLKALLENGRLSATAQLQSRFFDPHPVVKLFTPDAGATWLLSEIDLYEPDLAFGLCDLGLGFPELGTVRISELESLRGPMGLPIERDLYIVSRKSLAEYASDARNAGRITT